MSDLVVNSFILLGSFLILTSMVGLYKFHDSASRLHPPTKASVMGLSLILLASAIRNGIYQRSFSSFLLSHEILCLGFALVVAPLSGHILLKAFHGSSNQVKTDEL